MKRIEPAEHRRMPWKNGGGTTTEIYVAPAEGRFMVRLSIADVATDGPFSRFEGYDRHIMLLSGKGMTLDCGVDLRTPFEPQSFSGDLEVRGTLVDGPVRDFNFIADRSLASSLAVRRISAPTAFASSILYVLEGTDAGVAFVSERAFTYDPRGTARVAIAHTRP